ncbi:MAG TPA: chemotaxis protein CheC [Opitutaceae bacterium]
MELTAPQQDSLTELINIGYGRAAASLSDLTGHRIILEVPQVAMHRIDELTPLLKNVVQGEVASVNQIFSGPIAGNALLLMNETSALKLSKLLTEDDSARSFDANAREMITEVGNIVLNACLGVFGNLLHVQVTFAVPRMQVEGIESILHSITVGSVELQYALMIHTRFRIRTTNVTGYLVIILGITSLDRMLVELGKWEQRHFT